MTAKAITAIVFLALNVYAYRFFATDEVIPPRPLFSTLELAEGPWVCARREKVSDEDIKTLGLTDYLLCDFQPAEAEHSVLPFNLYLGYHERQIRPEGGGETVIHPPEHCMPGSGWDIIASEYLPIDFGIPGEAKRVVIAKGNQRRVVYFWYQSRGRLMARGLEKTTALFVDRARSGRTDGSLVRFTFPVGQRSDEEIDRIFREAGSWLMPQVDEYVPR